MLKSVCICFLALVVCIGAVSCTAPLQDGEMRFTFLDLRAGESSVLQCGQLSALIDCGGPTSFFPINVFLKQQGIQTLDALFLTHPHDDHIGAAEQIIQHYKPRTVYLCPLPDGADDFEAICQAAAAYDSQIKVLKVGDQLRLGEAKIEVLAPNSQAYSDLNNYSLVLKVIHQDHSLLLCGDAHGSSEAEMLLAGYDLDSDVIKIAHHGSASSSTQEFLEAVSPRYALVSNAIGSQNTLDLSVRLRLLNVGCEIYTTKSCGNITVFSDGTHLNISGEK